MTDSTTAPDLSIVLPAHNEVELLGSTVTNIVTGLDERKANYEVLVVENGSTDGTLHLARLLAERFEQLRVLTLPVGDYGQALAAGFEAANGELVVGFDVDYYDLAFLDTAVEMLQATDVAIVVASKRAPGADDRRPLARRGLTAAFAALLGMFFAMPVSDAHGMKAFRRAPVEPICRRCVMRQSLFDVELVIRASDAGLRLAEVPASVVERRPPRSAVWVRALQTIRGVAALRRALPEHSRHLGTRRTSGPRDTASAGSSASRDASGARSS